MGDYTMIEPYQWLVNHAEALGFSSELCGPSSVDLRLGGFVRWVYAAPHDSGEWNEFDFEKAGYPSVLFAPGCFYLCTTQEYVKVPPSHCALINMRSSWARQGLGHKMAGFVDPGFEGQITLELETAILLNIQIGTPLVQLIYMRLTEETAKPYAGKYLGQHGPTRAILT